MWPTGRCLQGHHFPTVSPSHPQILHLSPLTSNLCPPAAAPHASLSPPAALWLAESVRKCSQSPAFVWRCETINRRSEGSRDQKPGLRSAWAPLITLTSAASGPLVHQWGAALFSCWHRGGALPVQGQGEDRGCQELHSLDRHQQRPESTEQGPLEPRADSTCWTAAAASGKRLKWSVFETFLRLRLRNFIKLYNFEKQDSVHVWLDVKEVWMSSWWTEVSSGTFLLWSILFVTPSLIDWSVWSDGLYVTFSSPSQGFSTRTVRIRNKRSVFCWFTSCSLL